jgi:hypothetical protein
VLALSWSTGGPQVLLAALGLLAVARGSMALRSARSGQVTRATAVSAASTAWAGAVAVGFAVLGATPTGWFLVAGLVLLLPALATALPGRRTPLLAGAAVVVAAAVALGVLGGVDALLVTGRTVAAVLAVAVGLANLAGAVGMARIARRPAPAAAGCGGCACGAGGCGSLR